MVKWMPFRMGGIEESHSERSLRLRRLLLSTNFTDWRTAGPESKYLTGPTGYRALSFQGPRCCSSGEKICKIINDGELYFRDWNKIFKASLQNNLHVNQSKNKTKPPNL